MISEKHRIGAFCYCLKCDEIFNGSGGNIATHVRRHGRRRVFTQPERHKAFFYFVLMHNVGFSATRDPVTAIFAPDLSYQRITSLLNETVSQVRAAITEELREQDICIMLDGWSDQSLRRYLGIVAAYYDGRNNRIVHRFLDLNGGSGADHSADSQVEILRNVLDRYCLRRSQVSCMCSDSARVNTKIAENLDIDWMPCLLHLWNLIVKNFVANVPGLTDLLERINQFRKSSRWIEFLARHGQRRNLAGYCVTRWCSSCDAIHSFYQLAPYVRQFQQLEGKVQTFTQEDEQLVTDVGNIMRLLKETNDMLSLADERDGLATAFDIINAIYLALIEKAKCNGILQHACSEAAAEIELRFFRFESRYCSRIMLAGFLNVAHGLPEWLTKKQNHLCSLLIDELELFTGATPPRSPTETSNQRYHETSTLFAMINGSPPTSETSGVVEEVLAFTTARQTYRASGYMSFWKQCHRHPHIAMFAKKLRSYPTTTLSVERSFSKARRVLSWHRMKLSEESASRICLLYVNSGITKSILGLGSVTGSESMGDATPDEESEEIFEDLDEE